MNLPEPGVYVTRYSPATFPTCREHPLADAIGVLTVESRDEKLEAKTHSPVCAECGADLFSGSAAFDAEVEAYREEREVLHRADREIDLLTREFCDRVNEWMAEHDERVHGGEPCHDERGNILAYVCHRMGYSRETLLVMFDRLKDYDAIHAEHDHEGESK